MKTNSVVYVSGIQYTAGPEKRAKFDKWYEEEHIPIQLKARGMKKATYYKMNKPFTAPIIVCKAEDYPDIVLVYEFEDQKAFDEYWNGAVYNEVHQNVLKTWPEGRPFKILWRVTYDNYKTFEKQAAPK
jgi:hypothetical protein